jgi:hypothetical protein
MGVFYEHIPIPLNDDGNYLEALDFGLLSEMDTH